MEAAKKKEKYKIGIQGVKASFHDLAAQKYYHQKSITNQQVVLIESPSFGDLGLKLNQSETDFSLMAIENSIAGSILPNYALLAKYGFKIATEVYLRIEMSLMALPGQKIEDIQFVQSHPMALLQCERFLLSYPKMQALEAADTAESAKEIREKNKLGYAAIANKLAASVYDLEVLAEGIETNKQNYTRFLVIFRADDYQQSENTNKASICFEVTHQPRALMNVLKIFGELEVNLSKIQSVPIIGRPYEYSFHVDIEWQDREKYKQAMALILPQVKNLVHFGEYLKGEMPSGQVLHEN